MAHSLQSESFAGYIRDATKGPTYKDSTIITTRPAFDERYEHSDIWCPMAEQDMRYITSDVALLRMSHFSGRQSITQGTTPSDEGTAVVVESHGAENVRAHKSCDCGFL